MNRFPRSVLVGLVAALAIAGLTGCTATSSGTAARPEPAVTPAMSQPAPTAQPAAPAQAPSPTTSSPSAAAQADAGLPVTNGITGQIVTTPAGIQISTTSVDLPDVVSVRPEILGIGGGPGGNPVAMAAGNHVEGIRQEEVTLPTGPAYLAVVVRGQPSAANSDKKTNELWLLQVRKYPGRNDMRLAYVIRGEITGDEAKARAQLLELGQNWRLPAE